jgi:hypothetical protein
MVRSKGSNSHAGGCEGPIMTVAEPKWSLKLGMMHSLRIGDRIRLSRLGEIRNPRKSAKLGTVVSVKLHKSGPNSVLVLFDGRKEPSRLHWTYVERIDHSAIGRE